MVSIKTALVIEALVLDYIYYRYTHRKIPVLMVLIIEACEVIHLFQVLNFLSFSMILTALGHKNAHNFTALCRTVFF